MCVIIAGNSAKNLSPEWLDKAEKANSDGIGLAYLTIKGNVYYEKGISVERAKHLLKPVNCPFLIHFRLATVGGKNKALCHPFVVGKNAPLHLKGVTRQVLAHNGHWNDWKDLTLKAVLFRGLVFPSGHFSDTRAIAFLVAHYGPNILKLLESQKVSLLDSKHGLRFYGNWEDKDGFKLSNTFFLNSYTQYGFGGLSEGWEDKDGFAYYKGSKDWKKFPEDM